MCNRRGANPTRRPQGLLLYGLFIPFVFATGYGNRGLRAPYRKSTDIVEAIPAARSAPGARSGLPGQAGLSGGPSMPPVFSGESDQMLGSNLTAFLGAGLTRFAAGFAFGNAWPLLALFLAVLADHLDHVGKMAGML